MSIGDINAVKIQKRWPFEKILKSETTKTSLLGLKSRVAEAVLVRVQPHTNALVFIGTLKRTQAAHTER